MLEREGVLASADLVADMALSRHIFRGQVCNAVFEVWPWDPCSACCQMLRDVDVLDSMFEVCSCSRELFRYLCQSHYARILVLIAINSCYPLNRAFPKIQRAAARVARTMMMA